MADSNLTMLPLPGTNPKLFARFMAKVNVTDGCWLWTATKDTSGYGQIHADGRMELAHRLAHIIFTGPIPDGQFALHTCDVRACVNPRHVWLGTNADNMADMVAKCRQASGARSGARTHMGTRPRGTPRGCPRPPKKLAYGEYQWCSKLTENDVLDIRRLYADRTPQPELARQFRVSQTLVSKIVLRKIWKHI